MALIAALGAGEGGVIDDAVYADVKVSSVTMAKV